MKSAMILVVAAVGTGAWGNGVAGPVVTVCMDQFADSTVTYLAQREASKIFSEVTVQIAWRDGRACQSSDVIHIHLSNQTPPALRPGALAYARLDQDNYIEVFYDRAANAVAAALLPRLLAHVLVHEITHNLQGVARHSETGIMKAHYTTDDYRQMSIRHLTFAPEDVTLIQQAMANRSERLEAARVTPSFPGSR